MKRILISDTHFGVKQNSIIWLNAQLEFIYKQLIPFITNYKKSCDESVVLYHLGDVFDSRSSINPLTASRVRQAFMDLNRVVDQLFIIGGNHDYYSPNDDIVDSISIVLHPNRDFNPHLITHNMCVNQGDLFIPWYEYDNVAKVQQWIEDNDIKRVFCHADLTHIDDEHRELFKNVQVYSGHIHTPQGYRNLHTLGSTYALTFTDCNSDRGFYVVNDNDEVEFYANQHSIRFWRFRGTEIFEDIHIQKSDYVELYISQVDLTNKQYADRISELNKSYHNLVVIPVAETHIDESIQDFQSYDIEKICLDSIPDHLRDKFNQIIKDEN